MNNDLAEVIQAFRQAQDRAVATIRDEFQWPLPSSNREWVALCAEHNLHEIRELNGIRIYVHGYGIELRYPDLEIDFDWGENGEGNGFDGWRLWNHCEENGLFPHRCTHKLISCWLNVAFQKGQLRKDTHLYYLPHELPGNQGISPVTEQD